MSATNSLSDFPTRALRALGSESRLRVLQMLLAGELCVCELVDALGRPHYGVSRDLAELQRAGFVAERRVGTWVYHSIAAEARTDPFLGSLLRVVEARLATVPQARADLERLARRLALRVGDQCVVAVAPLIPPPRKPALASDRRN